MRIYVLAGTSGDYVRYVKDRNVAYTKDFDSAYKYHSYKQVQALADKHNLSIISVLVGGKDER